MKIKLLATFAIVLTSSYSLSFVPAQADQSRLPEDMGREAPRDTNIFQVEPTILDERYYTSGKEERHQFIGNTLPADAPIPDTQGAMPLTSRLGHPAAAPIVLAPAQHIQQQAIPASAH